MTGCFAPGDGISHTICLLCLRAINGPLRCALHGKQEAESGRNAERELSARSSTSARARRELNQTCCRCASSSHLRPVADCWDRQWLVAGHDKVTTNATSSTT